MLITISGLPGAGTTTVSRLVAEELGLDRLPGGEVFRQMAAEAGMSLAEFGRHAQDDPRYDHELDRRLLERARQGGVVIESRLAGWLATRGEVRAVRVWVACDDEERARRVGARDGTDVATALADNEAREAIEENNEEIKNSTERAEANRGVLAGLAGDMLDLRESAREAGASTADLTALQAEQADQFLDTAKMAGIEKDAALDLATQLGLIPESVATDIRERGADAVIEQARRVRDTVRAVTGEDYTVDIGARLPSRHELQNNLNALVWGLTAPTAQVRVRLGQSIE